MGGSISLLMGSKGARKCVKAAGSTPLFIARLRPLSFLPSVSLCAGGQGRWETGGCWTLLRFWGGPKGGVSVRFWWMVKPAPPLQLSCPPFLLESRNGVSRIRSTKKKKNGTKAPSHPNSHHGSGVQPPSTPRGLTASWWVGSWILKVIAQRDSRSPFQAPWIWGCI